MNRVLNQEALMTKNLKDEMKRKGLNAGKARISTTSLLRLWKRL